jgi:hypothetical protein
MLLQHIPVAASPSLCQSQIDQCGILTALLPLDHLPDDSSIRVTTEPQLVDC